MATQIVDLERERPTLWELLTWLMDSGDEILLMDGDRAIARLIPENRPPGPGEEGQNN